MDDIGTAEQAEIHKHDTTRKHRRDGFDGSPGITTRQGKNRCIFGAYKSQWISPALSHGKQNYDV